MKKIIIFSIVLTFISIIFSCKKEDEIISTSEIEPTGNDLINYQTTFGDENLQSSIIQMKSDDNGSFYYHGMVNGNNVIGKLNTNGSIIWEKNVNFQINDFQIENFIIYVGSSTNTNFTGIVAIYDTEGNFISDETWNNYQTVFFNGIKRSFCGYAGNENNFNFFSVIGGAGNSTICPYIANFHVGQNGEIIKGFPDFFNVISDKLFTNYPEMRFDKFSNKKTYFPIDQGTGNNNDDPYISDHSPFYYVTVYNETKDDLSVAKISENITLENPNLNISIDWITRINNTSSKIVKGDICFEYDKGIFVCGTEFNSSLGVNNKVAGILVKLSEDGEILWKNLYGISIHSDGYWDCVFNNNYIYAIGFGAFYTKNDNSFGYGLISKISSTTGNIISNKLIGDEKYYSNLNTVLFHNNNLFFAGFTKRYKLEEHKHQAWLVEFNQNGM